MPTLIDGTETPSNSPEWAAECLTRHKHVQTMFRITDRYALLEYVRTVREKEGDEAAVRLKDEYRRQWEIRQGEKA